MISKPCLCLLALTAGSCFGASILLPGGTLSIPALSSTGVPFTYTGTLTGADTIAFTQIGGTANDPCLQSGNLYCTNGGGIITIAGTSPVGATTTFIGTFNGTTATWNYGSLIMEISGEGAVQVFAANVADGLGSGTPPTGLPLNSISLSSLGFGSFTSALNPTITFVVADSFYSDNSRGFVLSQVPEPSTLWSVGAALAGLAVFGCRSLRRG
jgi:hypothetical protein